MLFFLGVKSVGIEYKLRGTDVFGTVIIDSYTKEETQEMASAIDDICSPKDAYGWASAGIYCFWDYYAQAILYIGLAGDLSERFRQHNGLLPIESGSKEIEIKEYFSKNDRIGYTIFVQSPMSQPLVHRNKEVFKKFACMNDSPVLNLCNNQGKDDIKKVEGILIESFKREYGYFPPWNKMGGSIDGQADVMKQNINIVKSFCDTDHYYLNPIVSRSTIMELSLNPTWAWFESFLHGVRMFMLNFGMDYKEALEIVLESDYCNTYGRICDSGYMNKHLVV